METVSNILPLAVRWEVAVRTKTPAHLARTFANQVGAFYDREEFDAVARRVSDLYSQENPENAQHFRSRLDRRLYDRYHTPVAWEVSVQADQDIPSPTS